MGYYEVLVLIFLLLICAICFLLGYRLYERAFLKGFSKGLELRGEAPQGSDKCSGCGNTHEEEKPSFFTPEWIMAQGYGGITDTPIPKNAEGDNVDEILKDYFDSLKRDNMGGDGY